MSDPKPPPKPVTPPPDPVKLQEVKTDKDFRHDSRDAEHRVPLKGVPPQPKKTK